MSGVKTTTTTISIDELNRLRAQASRAVTVEEQNAILNSQNAVLIQASENLERRMNQLETHNRTTRRTVAGMRSEIRAEVQRAVKAGEEAVRAAKEEARRAQEQISRAAVDNARAIEESRRRMSESLRQTEERLEQQIQQQNRRMNGLQHRVDQIVADNAALARQAADLFAAAEAVAGNARDFVRGMAVIGGDKPMQDALRRAQQALDLTEKHPANASVARQSAVDAFDQAQEFYQRAAAAEEIWNLRELAARQSVAAASARLENSRTLRIEEAGEDGTPVCVQVDVDYWSDGALNALAGRIHALGEALDGAQTIEDLDGVRAAADRVCTEIVDAVAGASIAAHESQNRSETACDFADSLADHGMTLIGHGFENGDKRGTHRIHMRDAVTGDEVIITQIPSRNADGSITTSVEADLISDTLSGETFERRGRDMYETLGLCADDNHAQTDVQTMPGYERRPSDRRSVLVQFSRGEEQPDRGDIQSAPAR